MRGNDLLFVGSSDIPSHCHKFYIGLLQARNYTPEDCLFLDNSNSFLRNNLHKSLFARAVTFRSEFLFAKVKMPPAGQWFTSKEFRDLDQRP